MKKEREEWTESDKKVYMLMAFVGSHSDAGSLSLENLVGDKKVNIVEDAHLNAGAVIDRLDGLWLRLLSEACLSTDGSGKFDTRTIQKTPLPILRSLLRRRIHHIADNNRSVNCSEVEPSNLESPVNLRSFLKSRGFPPSLTCAETRIWVQLEGELLTLLAHLIHIRWEHTARKKPVGPFSPKL